SRMTTDAPSMPLQSEFEKLFREHSQMLYRTAYSLLDNGPDAEDVLQTIFLRLLRGGLPRDFERNPKGYLYRAAVNLSLDTIRTRSRSRRSHSAGRSVPPASAPPRDCGGSGSCHPRCFVGAAADRTRRDSGDGGRPSV